MRSLAVVLAVTFAATPALARRAGPGEVCEDDKDQPLAPRRALVLDLVPESTSPDLAAAFSEDIRAGVENAEGAILLATDAVLEAGVAGAADCRKSACLVEIAKKTEARFIYYGTLRSTTVEGKPGWVADLLLFDGDKGRPIEKVSAQSTEPELIGQKLREAGRTLMPPPKKPKVVDCGPPTVFERPLFVLGAGVTMLGAAATVGAAAWALELEVYLAVPQIHRLSKQEALDNGPWAFVATGAAAAITAAGVGLLVAGALIVPEEGEE